MNTISDSAKTGMDGGLSYASVATPVPDETWARLSDGERLSQVQNALRSGMPDIINMVSILSCRTDGQVIVQLLNPVPVAQRGTLLLDVEEFLKKSIDPGLAIWLEPLGDRNSLRNLRGIEVKS